MGATPKPEFREMLKDVIAQPEWIIDGNFDSTLEMRAHYADLIIFLDFPNWLCLIKSNEKGMELLGTDTSRYGGGVSRKD